MQTAERLITADEYLAREFDDRFTELINGRIVVNLPLIAHQTIVGRIYLTLGNWVNAAAGRGYVWLPLDTKIDDYNVLAPDIVWVAQAHLPPRGSKYMVHPPDVVVEVRSPSTWNRDDRSSSVLRYRRAGEGLTRTRRSPRPIRSSHRRLPGLELDLSALFAPAF